MLVIEKTIEGLEGPSPYETALNQFLTITGKNPLPFSEDEIYDGITMLLTTAASLWAWWKNNSFTKAAIAGDAYKEGYKYTNRGGIS